LCCQAANKVKVAAKVIVQRVWQVRQKGKKEEKTNATASLIRF